MDQKNQSAGNSFSFIAGLPSVMFITGTIVQMPLGNENVNMKRACNCPEIIEALSANTPPMSCDVNGLILSTGQI